MKILEQCPEFDQLTNEDINNASTALDGVEQTGCILLKYNMLKQSEKYLPRVRIKNTITQMAFTCSKLTIETLEQRYEICTKLTIKPPKRRHWRRFGGLIVNFEHISHLCSTVSIVSFKHVVAGWEQC